MPELIEVEAYRGLAEKALGRRIAAVVAPDPWWLKGGLSADVLADALVGLRFVAARRIGKRLMLDTDNGGRVGDDAVGPVLGLKFGMTGRLLVDGSAGVEHLEYSSNREVEAWDRLLVAFADGGDLRVRDPRRLGGAELDPEEGRLGPDAVGLTLGGLRAVLGTSRIALKARLMDQSKIAGLGNLLVDEALFQAGLDPARPASGLDEPELRRLHRALRKTLTNLTKRGGSHTGGLQPARRRDGLCPLDGAPLLRRTIGGRTTFSCPVHQH
jgi:formamidopyrimidine-DNA glycosylase